MRISIFGLGYVGCVSAACLARDGHEVAGVDRNSVKARLVAEGRSPIIEPGLGELVGEVVRSGRLRVSQDSQVAVRESDMSVICVGTPGDGNGRLNLQYIKNVCGEIGLALANKQGYHVVVVRSTVLPGTVEEQLIPLLEHQSGRRAGRDFGVCMNPEFLREGSAVADYSHPSYVVIGEVDLRSGDQVQHMYEGVAAPVIRTPIRTAEMLKYVNNAFHAVKVAFANEIGNLCKSLAIDGQQVMDIFCQDRRLNISPAYLKPGFAFGGSCLPKDLRALLYRAKECDLDTPLLSTVLLSNQRQIQRGIELIERMGRKKIGVLGLSFKAGTDDVRESPVIPLIETLVGRGYQVCVYDETVRPERLIGANKSFLDRELPHVAMLMCLSLQKVVSESEVVVVANSSPAFHQVRESMRDDQVLVDLVGIARGNEARGAVYEGAGW
ncbi:MAG: nucleotide sugar dehydrogenase [Chloroflexi bacterium]|nr:nucleotide sugar dehydrogenase [Chloroflexota bacterium]